MSVDSIARFADAWDGRGAPCFAPPFEHRALIALAGLEQKYRDQLDKLRTPMWRNLTDEERRQLFFAARRAVELGRQCAWVFGEGEGARL